MDFAGGSPTPAGTEGTSGFDEGCGGASPLSFGEGTELPDEVVDSTKVVSGDCVGLPRPGSAFVFGKATG